MVQDLITTINMHPVRDSYIEDEINHLINRYLHENNETIENTLDLTAIAEFTLGYPINFGNIKELYPALRSFNGDILGCTDFETKEIIIDSDLYENNIKRANFTIAHEITHIILHEKHYFIHKDQLNLDLVTKKEPSFICRDYQKVNDKKPIIEQQADKGASFLLMPKKLLNHKWGNVKSKYSDWLNLGLNQEKENKVISILINEFSDEIQVSKQALEIRIKNLGVEFFGFMKEGEPRQVGLFE